jgi:hypothetical protein
MPSAAPANDFRMSAIKGRVTAFTADRHYEFNGSFYDGLQRREGAYVDLIGELSLFHNDKLLVKRTFEFWDLGEE